MGATEHYTRSKTRLENGGYKVWKVEQPWNQYTKVRRDLFNLMDILAIDGKSPAYGVQVTDGTHGAEHVVKALGNEYLKVWLGSGCRYAIHIWRTLLQDNADGKRGKRSKWELKVIEFFMKDGAVATETRENN